jgi:hypothetical protein
MSLSISTQSHSSCDMRALAIALAGASVAAVGTMLVPLSMLEGLAGSTGLSELLPAARAPLGDIARALLAFGAGAVTLAGMLILLLRPEPKAIQVAATAAAQEDGERLAFAAVRAKMPWNKGDDDIRELADLPRLRNGDVHPDAPARRPLCASQDLPTLELSQPEFSPEVEPPPVNDVQTRVVAETSLRSACVQASLAEMVAQLEAAVAQRHVKLAELEAVAARIVAGRSLPDPTPEAAAPMTLAFPPDVSAAPFVRRPVLEAVPSVPRQDNEVDAALSAALATLQRMSAAGG